jgi:hypothetical protein
MDRTRYNKIYLVLYESGDDSTAIPAPEFFKKKLVDENAKKPSLFGLN